MINQTLKIESLKEITPSLIKKAILLTKGKGITSTAPLGSSGDTIIIFNSSQNSYNYNRISQISVRLYNENVELLITNKEGVFLFYGKYCYLLGVDFIASEYFRIFKKIGRINILKSKVFKKNTKEII